MPTKCSLGQYFTTNIKLKEKVFEFILNSPNKILEPSIGQGDLIDFIYSKTPIMSFDMYEIDEKIKLLPSIKKKNVIYGDFIKQKIQKKYKTIIGNPPYIRTKTGNLYIDFIKKCYNLLENNGELIFIVPADFFKLTNASKLLDKMITTGTFTHIFHPESEKMFKNASINIIIFRYCKNNLIKKQISYNGKMLHIINNNGLITFSKEKTDNGVLFKDYFDIFVGIVSGRDAIYKNNEFGNIGVLNGQDKIEKYIYIEKFPSDNEKINGYLLKHKNELIQRKIKKFNENNWFEWGAPRNLKAINKNRGENCIYIYNLTRKQDVAFLGQIDYFGGNLLMLKPKKSCSLTNIVSYLNSMTFKCNFMFSGRFKIGHRQLCNSIFSKKYI